MEVVFSQFTNFLNQLDWMYIFSFMLITYMLNYYKVLEYLGQQLGVTLQKRYQVLLIGVVYAAFVFFIRGYALNKVLTLFTSFLFATGFYKFLLQTLVERFIPHSVPPENKEVW